MPARIAIAAGIVLFAWWLSRCVRHVAAFVDTNPARLGFEMMGIGIGLAVFAIGVAFALPGPVARRLGLGPSRLPITAVIALTFGTLGLSHAIEAALDLFAARALEGSVAVGISRGLHASHDRDLAIGFFGTVLAPAIGEELLCRGLLQRTLARWIDPAAAIAIAALAFGSLHGELVHGSIAASLGAYLGLTAYWSDSTRPAIAAHAANNLLALLGSAGLVSLRLPAVPSLVAGLALAAVGIGWGWIARPRGDARAVDRVLQPDRGPADA
ncbi:MAG TPA: type II CAAX endopeptidase family protein [Myxococcota bacterium]|nr:type II CAAX endopeptidase family protein [Myxococcota bacterium]